MAFGLLNPNLMAPPQRLRSRGILGGIPDEELSPMAGGSAGLFGAPQAAASLSPPSPPGAGPVPAGPRSRVGERLRGFLDPEIALPMAGAMIAGETPGESFGNAFMMAGQGIGAKRKREREEAQRKATVDWLKQNRPDLAGAVEAGIPIGDAASLLNTGGDPTDDIREYEFARQQGYQGTFQDFMTDMKKAGATNVTVGGDGAPGLGKLSADYGYVLDPATNQPVIDPQTGLPSAAAIPGSPAAQEAEQVAASSESKEEQQRTWNLIVNDEIGRALHVVEGDSVLPTTGLGSETMAGIGGTAARDLKGLLDTVKANAGFDRLQAMRDASPTGGALGQVSERELAFLQSTIGNLEQSQSKEQLTYNLKRLKKIYENMLNGKRAYDGLLESSDGTAKEGWTDLGNGVRIRKLD